MNPITLRLMARRPLVKPASAAVYIANLAKELSEMNDQIDMIGRLVSNLSDLTEALAVTLAPEVAERFGVSDPTLPDLPAE